MHYTISKEKAVADAPGMGEGVTYVVGHSLGDGWTRHIVQLAKGDTADNPASTKGPIYGPAFVVYDCHRSGISVAVLDSAGEFYDQLRPSKADREHAAEIIDSYIDDVVLDGMNADDPDNHDAAAELRSLAVRLRHG